MVLDNLNKLFISLAGIAIIMVVAFLVLAQGISQADTLDATNDFTNVTECGRSITCNATGDIQNAMASAVDWLPIIIITIIGGLLIGLVAFFRGRR